LVSEAEGVIGAGCIALPFSNRRGGVISVVVVVDLGGVSV